MNEKINTSTKKKNMYLYIKDIGSTCELAAYDTM